MQLAISEYMTPAREDPQHMVSKTDPLWPYNQTHLVPPLNTLLPPHNMVTTIEPMQEGIFPLVPTMERGVVMRVEVI